MAKSKKEKKPGDHVKTKTEQITVTVESDADDVITEIDSDGSANAFEETETIEEDNFDNLSEK